MIEVIFTYFIDTNKVNQYVQQFSAEGLLSASKEQFLHQMGWVFAIVHPGKRLDRISCAVYSDIPVELPIWFLANDGKFFENDFLLERAN